MPPVLVSPVFKDAHPVMPWRVEFGGPVKIGHRARTAEKAAEFRDRTTRHLAGKGHELVDAEVRDLADVL